MSNPQTLFHHTNDRWHKQNVKQSVVPDLITGTHPVKFLVNKSCLTHSHMTTQIYSYSLCYDARNASRWHERYHMNQHNTKCILFRPIPWADKRLWNAPNVVAGVYQIKTLLSPTNTQVPQRSHGHSKLHTDDIIHQVAAAMYLLVRNRI